MRALHKRPRVFLSSTIYDFRDLRSALKYWLEELGYEVDASEFNDMVKPLDPNSYESCLKSIDGADYFILLIGARAGGAYDKAAKTSITMMEYRHAYERAKTGGLKLATFVRQSVWDAREDRAALGRMLKTEYAKEHHLSEEDVDRIKYHSSQVVADADVVFSFIGEVGRVEEMKLAAEGKGPRPPANWIHTVGEFRDVVDALRPHLAGAERLRRVAFTANLRHELIQNLRLLLEKTPSDPTPSPAYLWASRARRQFSSDPLGRSKIKGQDLMLLSVFALTEAKTRSLRTQQLDAALTSGEFLVFDRSSDLYAVGVLQGALVSLRENISWLFDDEEQFSTQERMKMVDRFRPYKNVQKVVEIENVDLHQLVGIHDRHVNITTLSAAVVRALDGDESHLHKLNLYPRTPFTGLAENIEAETPTSAEVVEWLAKLMPAP